MLSCVERLSHLVNPSYPGWVAIVDDEAPVRDALLDLLDEAGFPACAFASGEAFLESGRRDECACLITDIRMPGISGLDLQARLNAARLRIPTIFITAHGDERMRTQALRAGAVEFLAKPFDDEVLLEMVRAALDRRHTRIRSRATRYMTNDVPTPGITPLAQRLLDTSPDALLTITEDGRVVSWNRGAESMFGYTPEELSAGGWPT